MPEFSSRPERIEQAATAVWEQRERLDQLAEETQAITRSLQSMTQMESPLYRLAQTRRRMQAQGAALGRMSAALDTVSGLYRQAETQACEAGDGSWSTTIWPDMDTLFSFATTPVRLECEKIIHFLPATQLAARQELASLTSALADEPDVLVSTLAAAAVRTAWWKAVPAGLCTGTVAMLDSEILRQFQA